MRYGGLSLALALTIAVVGTNAFADAAGFPEASNSQRGETGMFMRILCAFVLFFLSWMLLRFLFQLGIQTVWHLGQVRERPGLPMAISLLFCGTLCVLGALLVVWHSDSGSLSVSPEMNMPRNMPGTNMQGNMLPQVDFSMRTTGSLTRPLAVSAALVIGTILLALGIWSSLTGKETGKGVSS